METRSRITFKSSTHDSSAPLPHVDFSIRVSKDWLSTGNTEGLGNHVEVLTRVERNVHFRGAFLVNREK